MYKLVDDKVETKYMVYDENENLIGYVDYSLGENMVLTFLFVEPQYRRQGNGTKIADLVYEEIKSKGIKVYVTCGVLGKIYSKEKYQDIIK